jgi:cytoskeletal protein RodZ
MKKVLLSSIIMLAVCGYATAQNVTGSKFQKAGTTTSSAAPAPQKAAVVNSEESVKTSDVPASDKAAKASAVAPAPNDKAAKMKAAQVKPAEEIGADGTPVTNDAAAQKKADDAKIAAEKAERNAGKKNN